MKEKKIVLDYPLTIDGKEVKELTMRRAKVRDVISSEEAGITPAVQEVALFGKMVGINPEDIQELDMCDYAKLQEAYKGFLSSTRKSAV